MFLNNHLLSENYAGLFSDNS